MQSLELYFISSSDLLLSWSFQFLCLRNIRIFLRACHEKLQLREADLFDPSMLFDLSNFHRVLCTLAKVSQCPKAQAKSIQ